MKISIITATWNSGATLRDTMESVLAQSYQNYEHIIVDGLSKDNTLDIVKEYESQYKSRLIVISEKDNGLYDAMNKGIAMASGDVIGILNSDDFYADDEVLERIAHYIKDVETVYGDLVFVDFNNTSKIIRKWNGSQYNKHSFYNGWSPAHPTFYAKKSIFEKFGGFDLSFNVSADFELMFRFLEKGQASSKYIPFTLVKMRMGGESTGSIKNIIEGNKNILRAFKKNGFKVPHFYIIRRLTPKVVDFLTQNIHLRHL